MDRNKATAHEHSKRPAAIPAKRAQAPAKSASASAQHSKMFRKVVQIIRSGEVAEINSLYGDGPALYFYRKMIKLRQRYPDVNSLIQSSYAMEMLYATLLAWDMNCRSAKMQTFGVFQSSLLAQAQRLAELDTLSRNFNTDKADTVLQLLQQLYTHINIMQSKRQLVSFSKLMHLLFPQCCMPMDGKNTLEKLFGNKSESWSKYLEVMRFAYHIMDTAPGISEQLDDQWNTCASKIIDNAIVLSQP